MDKVDKLEAVFEAVSEAFIEEYQDLEKKIEQLQKDNKAKQEAIDSRDKTIRDLKESNKALVELVSEMNDYLDKGHGTNIGCGSIFHQQLKAIANEQEVKDE